MRTYFQVFVNSVYGSDVVGCDTLKEAIDKAKEWQKEVKEEVIILKVVEQEIKWRNIK